MATPPASFLATRRGRLTLLLLCAVQFLDVADSSIMNVALPSIRRDLGFSVQTRPRPTAAKPRTAARLGLGLTNRSTQTRTSPSSGPGRPPDPLQPAENPPRRQP